MILSRALTQSSRSNRHRKRPRSPSGNAIEGHVTAGRARRPWPGQGSDHPPVQLSQLVNWTNDTEYSELSKRGTRMRRSLTFPPTLSERRQLFVSCSCDSTTLPLARMAQVKAPNRGPCTYPVQPRAPFGLQRQNLLTNCAAYLLSNTTNRGQQTSMLRAMARSASPGNCGKQERQVPCNSRRP